MKTKSIFETNNNINKVVLNAWGQDAYYHVNEIVQGIWSNDKASCDLWCCSSWISQHRLQFKFNIESGTKIHGHSNAVLYIYKSSINVNGNIE